MIILQRRKDPIGKSIDEVFVERHVSTFSRNLFLFSHKNVHNRDAIGQCGGCVEIPGCGFCLDSLRCEDLTTNSSTGFCPEWIQDSSSCPGKYIIFISSIS